MNLLPRITPQTPEQRQAAIKRSLLKREADIGGRLFGPIPKGHNRQFFCLDQHTWIWHEEWHDAKGRHHAITTRYEVRPSGVIKCQDGQAAYQRLSPEEARNLYQATQLYGQQVNAEYDRLLLAG